MMNLARSVLLVGHRAAAQGLPAVGGEAVVAVNSSSSPRWCRWCSFVPRLSGGMTAMNVRGRARKSGATFGGRGGLTAPDWRRLHLSRDLVTYNIYNYILHPPRAAILTLNPLLYSTCTTTVFIGLFFKNILFNNLEVHSRILTSF